MPPGALAGQVRAMDFGAAKALKFIKVRYANVTTSLGEF
jgi:hypothetical protein